MENENNVTVQTTREYSKFKKLKGDRVPTQYRVNRLISSIKKVGYIGAPIIVNEKMEIVDGQARVEALETLSLSVPYIVVPGAGLDEAMALNGVQSKAAADDFKVDKKEG